MLSILPTILFFIVAVMYGAVGLGGGTGYLAVSGLVQMSPDVMRPTALALNILVASIGTWKYVGAGHFSARVFWPVAGLSIPFAALGGRLSLPADFFRPIVATILLYAAVRLWRSARVPARVKEPAEPLPIRYAFLAGAGIGLLSGLIGVGGGVFLGPLLLLTGWSAAPQAMGITAAFVLVNSFAGLLGHLSAAHTLPPQIVTWMLAVGCGGWLGAELGNRHLNPAVLRALLALVLVAGALRTIFP